MQLLDDEPKPRVDDYMTPPKHLPTAAHQIIKQPSVTNNRPLSTEPIKDKEG